LADLEEAFNAQLLQETPGGYAFTHALLRETVYWHLNDIRRRRLHASAGETIERLAGERVSDVAAELAHHFSVAERLVDVRDTAAAMSAFDAALVELDATGDQPEAVMPRFRLQTERGYLWFLQGRFVDMLTQGEELVGTATALGQPLLIFWSHNAVALAQMGL